jgi:hypothetical protein
LICHTGQHIKLILQTGLFSATIAPLLAVTVLDLKESPQDKSNFYLEKIYNQSVGLPSTRELPPFSAPKSVIGVNALWSLSLCISLTCAMLATLQQQWARRYLRLTEKLPRFSPHDRARMRQVFASGADNLQFSWEVEALRILIQVSLFLFFIGLLIYLFNIDHTHTVIVAVVWFVWIYVLRYLLIAAMRIFRLGRPYYSLFSSFIGLSQGIEKLAEATIQKSSTEIDDSVLKWLFDGLIGDKDLLQFFESIPGFCRSLIVKDPIRNITKLGKDKLGMALKKFLERTWFSEFLSDSNRMRRLVACAKVADAVGLPDASSSTLNYIFPWDSYQVLPSVEMGQSLRSRNNNQEEIRLCAQSIVAGIISNVRERDKGWIALAADQLGKTEGVIRAYLELEHGKDNVLLVNLIHITRQIFDYSLGDDLSREMAYASAFVLRSLTKFNIRNALPGLQYDFLALFTEIVLADAPNNDALSEIYDSLLDLYIALEDTNGASTAPLASDPSITSSPVLDRDASTTTPLSPSGSWVPGYTTATPTDESSPGNDLDTAQPIVQATMSSHTPLEPLASDAVSGDFQYVPSQPAQHLAITLLTP